MGSYLILIYSHPNCLKSLIYFFLIFFFFLCLFRLVATADSNLGISGAISLALLVLDPRLHEPFVSMASFD